jgi:hypothetical protein
MNHSGENHPKSGHGHKKNIPSAIAGRWQDVSVPANAPLFPLPSNPTIKQQKNHQPPINHLTKTP